MKKFTTTLAVTLLVLNTGFAQITERERPKEWGSLVQGARFIDRFLPMKGKVLSSDTWGASSVVPRFIDNGIEDRIWSYWGGNILQGEDGKYHLFVCGWLESSARGHREWSNSIVFNAIGDNLQGPFVVHNVIGKGHNPEVFQLKDGRYVLYVINGRYVADDINGKWEYGKFEFNQRDRRLSDGFSNMSFTRREDGSFVMVSRGGEIFISEDGISEYGQLSDKRVYPPIKGNFEDPVIWKDHIQYHLIVNDWLGRIAYYLRSKDGINWVVDPGEAYMPGIAVHEDGRTEDWFKYERIKIFQDKYGRAIQANFAVIDTLKQEDKASDNHSSKNICIPLNPGLLLTVLDLNPITSKTKTIRVKIHAEDGFNPQTDIDVASLRFGASQEVNYGRGCEVLKTENDGKDLIVTFNGKGNGIDENEFAPKLIGKTKANKLLYGYARLPYVNYIEPALSARAPVFTKNDDRLDCSVEVQNFGQVASKKASVKIAYKKDGKQILVASGIVPELNPYEKTNLKLPVKNVFEEETEYDWTVTIYSGNTELSTFNLKKKIEVAQLSAQVENLPIYPGKYQPTDESLKTYQYPEWFRDVKFGIWSHWGPQAVPRQGDWYARGMYEHDTYDCEKQSYVKANRYYTYHVTHYGHPSEFGYKDIIPLWKAERWNPDELMKLYKRVGARYFVSMATHHDNFFLWDSKLHHWNSVKMGPMKDVVGLWQAAAKEEGIYFGVSEHLGASYTWFQRAHRSDQLGNKAGVPYDGNNPEYWDLYHEPAQPGDNRWYTNNPKWQRQWYDRILELIDNYHPDLLYTDGGLPFGNDVGRSMIAHYYNQDTKQKKPQGVVYTSKEASNGRWVQDYERGSADGIREFPWQTDTSIGDWYYRTGQKYMSAEEIIQMLIDVVSKNGNLLLNVVQTPEGDLEQDVLDILEKIAAWMEVNSRAIYNTRPWKTYGEGASVSRTQEKSRFDHLADAVKDVRKYQPGDIRFTANGKTLYAFCMEIPDGDIHLQSLGLETETGEKITSVNLLGSNEKIQWTQNNEEVIIRKPSGLPAFNTIVFEILM